jgi:hypothetical protein
LRANKSLPGSLPGAVKFTVTLGDGLKILI